MRRPRTYTALEDLGRVRLSRHFALRNFLYSEIGNFYAKENIPDDPDLMIAAGTRLATECLDPLVETFGPIDIRSGYRSPSLNHFGATEVKPQKCSANPKNLASRIWDQRDAKGRMGACVSIVIPWFAVQYNGGRDWRDLAWWLYDHLRFHDIWFFPKNAAFNLGWREKPEHRILSYIRPMGKLVVRGMTPDPARHKRYADFPAFRGIQYPGVPRRAHMTGPVVLLPGMMCDARLFWPQIAALSGDIAIQVAPVTTGETIEEIAQAVLAGAPATFALAGLSMGGIVAMEVLRRAPDRVTRLALMDTNCQSELPGIAAAREPQIIGAKTGRLEEIMRLEMKPNYLAPGPGRVDVLNTVMDMALDLGPEVFVRQSRALQRRPDQQGTLRRAKTPTVILCGEYDALCPVQRHEFMAHLMPNAALEIISAAGHLPTLERPAQVTALLRRWLCAEASQPLAN